MKISLVSCAAKPPENVFLVNIPLDCIHVLRQMRGKSSEEGLDELTMSIKETGQMNPGIVIALPKAAAQLYLKRINDMWGTAYSLAQFESAYVKEAAQELYMFLVAGHRRLQAVTRASIGHFYCYVRLETSFSQALHLQFQENLHEQVAAEDEARFLTLLWRDEKEKKPALTLARFARRLGKRPETVRKSIRFTVLPISVQKLVQPNKDFKKGAAFGILCELARLQEARTAAGKGYSEHELIQLAYVLVTQQKTVKAAAAWVTEHIKELEGQNVMFELSVQEAAQSARRGVSSGVESVIRSGEQHLAAVARFHQGGHIARIPSQGAVKAVERTLSLACETAPQIIEGLKGGRGSRHVRGEIERVARRA